jgi:hypothetical protein
VTNNSLLKGRNLTARRHAAEHKDNWKLANIHTMTGIFHSAVLGGVRRGDRGQTRDPEIESHALLTELALGQKRPKLVLIGTKRDPLPL